jgi:Dolichyl-phosphate-mannose-protein mannosyltransferase
MQVANTARSVIYGRESWIIFFAIVIVGIFAAFFLYGLDRFSLLYYGDSISHLVRARELVDSNNPGLFEQLGTVWLPLPHILLLPFTLIEPLFRTGFAGTALSLPCLAITSVFLYKIIKSHLNVGNIAIVGALLYATNPNILYMGVTPMTEAPFMLFFVGGAYYFMRWMSGSGNYPSLSSQNEREGPGITMLAAKQVGGGNSALSFPVFSDLIMCSIFILLATLCRYEGWVLPLFFVTFVVTTIIRKHNHNHGRKYKIRIILVSSLSFSGIILWLIWNAYAYNDPLEFTNATYFSAAAQALEGTNRAFLILQPWNVASLYGLTAFAIYGPVLIFAAFFGYLFHKYLGRNDERRRRRNLYLFLVMPPIFTIVSLLVGIGEMNQRQWFNSRFLILMAPLTILLVCVFIFMFPHRIKKNLLLFGGLIFLFFAYQFATPVLGVVIFLNANNQFSEIRHLQVKTAEILSKEYDGKSTILLIAGSSQQNDIMQASRIPLKQFDPILESNSHKNSFQEPWNYAGYILIAKIPDSSAENVVNYWLERQGLLNEYYRTIYENEYYMIKKLS